MGSLERRYAEALLSLTDNVEQADVVGSALGVLGRLYQKNSEFRSFILNPVISQHIRSETLLGILEMLGYIKNTDDAGDETATISAPASSRKKKPVSEAAKAAKAAKAVKVVNEALADAGQNEVENNGSEVSEDEMAAAVANAGVMLLRFLQLLLDKGRLAFLPNIAEEYNCIKAKHRKMLHIVARSATPLESDELYELCEKYKSKYGAVSAEIDNIVEPSMLGEVSVQIGGMRIDDTIYGRLAALARAVAGGAVKQTAEARYIN